MLKVTLPREEAADQLREQASCCRRLARNSLTEPGSDALLTVASQFESDAFRMVRKGEGQADGHDNAQDRLRAALARQDAFRLRRHPGAARPAKPSDRGD